MARHQGFVASLEKDSKAVVIIRPGTPGIPSAPPESRRDCHCPTDGSTVTVEAWNRAGAEVGDRVLITQSPGILKTNAVTLLGIPGMGLILGIVAGAAVYQNLHLHPTVSAVIGAAVLLLANLIAAIKYRRRAAENLPVIIRVIKSRQEMSASG